MTLEQALQLARISNAQLPVARLGTEVAAKRVAQARGRLGPRVSVTINAPYTPPTLSYYPGSSASEASALIQVHQPLYEGNTLRGQLEADRQRLESAAAGYRISERDLELEVRSRFSEVHLYDATIKIEQEGITRLRTYLSMVKARMAAGQGLESDLLKTEVRLDEQRTLLIDARRNRKDAQIEFNVLLGRAPDSPLSLAALPEPKALPSIPEEKMPELPDFLAVEADRAAAEAEVSVTSGKYLPHLGLFANAGLIDPNLVYPSPSSPFNERLRSDLGVAVGIDFSWDIWNFGAYRAEVAQARLTAQRATASILVTQRKLGLEYAKAREDLIHWYDEYRTRNHQVPIARDAYLASESLYRGGQGTALNVLDSFSSWVSVERSRAEALYQLRVSEARLIRQSGGAT